MSYPARHFFMSGNTTEGFYSYFDYIIDQREAKRIYCIKGGPGLGKSTFMKNIGVEMEEINHKVEYIHCSSDCNSIDGVVISDKKVALLDGTAPHVVDPKNPAAVDEILNIGEFWDREKITQHKTQIIDLNQKISINFSRAYKYLKAAKHIYNDINDIYSKALDNGAFDIYACGIKNTELKKFPINNKTGKIRKGFAGSISPQGLVNYIDTLSDNTYKKIIVRGEPGTRSDILIKKIMNDAVQRGLDVEAFYCPMDPQNKIEHLIIPDAKIAILTSNEYHYIECNCERIIDLNKITNMEKLKDDKEVLKYNKRILDNLINRAIFTIKQAKLLHDDLETYYTKYMNFDKLNNLKERIIREIIE